MKAQFEGMRPGEPVAMDELGRRLNVTLRLVPETPQEVAELKKFCRLTGAFEFVIDENYRDNTAHIAPVFGQHSFRIIQRLSDLYMEEAG
jgi:hypothetical protein